MVVCTVMLGFSPEAELEIKSWQRWGHALTSVKEYAKRNVKFIFQNYLKGEGAKE